MTGAIASGYTVMVLGENGPVCGDKHRPERLVSRFQGLGGKFHAAMQMSQFKLVHHCDLVKVACQNI